MFIMCLKKLSKYSILVIWISESLLYKVKAIKKDKTSINKTELKLYLAILNYILFEILNIIIYRTSHTLSTIQKKQQMKI